MNHQISKGLLLRADKRAIPQLKRVRKPWQKYPNLKKSISRTHSACVNIADEDDIARAAAKALALVPIYGVVNNAGIYPRASILDAPLDMWRHVLNTNLLGTVMTTKAFAPHMLVRQQGVFVNMASGREIQGAARGTNYAASKVAILSFTKSVALEFAPYLRVNALILGVTETA